MPDIADTVHDRLRSTGDVGREAPWGATAESVAGAGRRRAGAPPGRRERLVLRTTNMITTLQRGWHRLAHGPAVAVRRLAVLGFVAVLVAGATAGVLAAGHPAARGARPAASSIPGTTPIAGAQSGTSTTTPGSGPAGDATTTTVGSATPTGPTGTTEPPSTTTTVPTDTRLSGYQQVSNTTSATCPIDGPAVPQCTNGGLQFGPSASVTASCPSGKNAIGGGGSAQLSPQQSGNFAGNGYVQESEPTADGTGWTVTGGSTVTGGNVTITLTVTAFAICASVGPGS